jgi:hypothetical protein
MIENETKNIRAILILEIIGRPAEHLTETLEKIIEENIDSWLKNKKYKYKNMSFNNHIYFIVYYCIENNAERCREITHDYLKNRDLCRNLHKKNVIKYIKWNN